MDPHALADRFEKMASDIRASVSKPVPIPQPDFTTAAASNPSAAAPRRRTAWHDSQREASDMLRSKGAGPVSISEVTKLAKEIHATKKTPKTTAGPSVKDLGDGSVKR